MRIGINRAKGFRWHWKPKTAKFDTFKITVFLCFYAMSDYTTMERLRDERR